MCADRIGMVIHPSKSQYLTVNVNDSTPVILGEVKIGYTEEYTYLGTKISNSSCSQQVKAHVESKHGHVLKFNSFISKNNDAPFSIKKSVWDSALNASILYSSR